MTQEENAMSSTVQITAPVNGLRSRAPVFVLGCPRSGTTLLYHILLSAGNFAIYREESSVFSVLAPRFGDLRNRANLEKLLETWLQSRLFVRTGLDASDISARVMSECKCPGDFLRVVMESMARQQGVERWADCTPDHLLEIREIKRQIPNALIIHIIRDGRDVALSYAKQGWAHPLWWDQGQNLAVSALYWNWIVRKGREQGRALGQDYHEVFFEDLVNEPSKTLARLSPFVAHDLDLDRIRKSAIGSVHEPNSSFLQEPDEIAAINPVGRWKRKMKPDQAALLEGLVGDLLEELGYPVSEAAKTAPRLMLKRMRTTYPALFTSKLWLKMKTPARRFSDLSRIGIGQT
jgi:hypothetical protein